MHVTCQIRLFDSKYCSAARYVQHAESQILFSSKVYLAYNWAGQTGIIAEPVSSDSNNSV